MSSPCYNFVKTTSNPRTSSRVSVQRDHFPTCGRSYRAIKAVSFSDHERKTLWTINFMTTLQIALIDTSRRFYRPTEMIDIRDATMIRWLILSLREYFFGVWCLWYFWLCVLTFRGGRNRLFFTDELVKRPGFLTSLLLFVIWNEAFLTIVYSFQLDFCLLKVMKSAVFVKFIILIYFAVKTDDVTTMLLTKTITRKFQVYFGTDRRFMDQICAWGYTLWSATKLAMWIPLLRLS